MLNIVNFNLFNCIFLLLPVFASHNLNALNSNENMFHQGNELRLNGIRAPLNTLIEALEYCAAQLDESEQKHSIHSVKDILDLVLMVNVQSKQVVDTIENDHITNEFFVFQDTKTIHKINKINTLYNSVSRLLKNINTEFPLLTLTTPEEQNTIKKLREALTEFLFFHNLCNTIITGKVHIPSGTAEIEIVPNIENDQSMAEYSTLEENRQDMNWVDEFHDIKMAQDQSIQHYFNNTKKRKFSADSDTEYHNPNKSQKISNDNNILLRKNAVTPPFEDFSDELLIPILLDQAALAFFEGSAYVRHFSFQEMLRFFVQISLNPASESCKRFQAIVQPISRYFKAWYDLYSTENVDKDSTYKYNEYSVKKEKSTIEHLETQDIKRISRLFLYLAVRHLKENFLMATLEQAIAIGDVEFVSNLLSYSNKKEGLLARINNYRINRNYFEQHYLFINALKLKNYEVSKFIFEHHKNIKLPIYDIELKEENIILPIWRQSVRNKDILLFHIIDKYFEDYFDNISNHLKAISQQSKRGNSVLHIAFRHGAFEIAQQLLSHYNESEYKKNSIWKNDVRMSINHAFVYALREAQWNNINEGQEIISLMLQKRDLDGNLIIDLAARNEKNETPLEIALTQGNEAIIELILDAENDLADSLLHRAIFKEDLELIRLILKEEGSRNRLTKVLNKQNREGWTPLHSAVMAKKNTQIIQLFLEHKKQDGTIFIDLNLRDQENETALDWAEEMENSQEIITLLQDLSSL